MKKKTFYQIHSLVSKTKLMSTMKCVVYYDNVKTENFFGNDFWRPVYYSSVHHH